jgi:mannose-1-phosphate guanylyltransferase/mannose-6-phosphate isomerase
MLPSSVHPVILCGGSGSRLWPLSRTGFPKQFQVLPGDESSLSLFQQAILRVNSISRGDLFRGSEVKIGSTLIVTNDEHRFLVLEQLRELNCLKIELLLESGGRNTAPALTLAALQAECSSKCFNDEVCEPILVVTPADQIISDEVELIEALQNCIATVCDDSAKQIIAI